MKRWDRHDLRVSRALASWPLLGVLVLVPANATAADPAPGTSGGAGGHWQVPGEIQQPKGTWQVPGQIQKAGDLQKPGEIQKIEEKCRTRLVLGADTLFEFDRADLTTGAVESLGSLASTIRESHARAASVEGHTDVKGADDYNQKLSERRAVAVRDWLVAEGAVAAGTPIVGYGESSPAAPNAKPDGSDDPEGRARNRRVEIVLTTCEP